MSEKINGAKKYRGTAMGFLQKLGKSMMLPVACMPICGILMGIGYWLCPAAIQSGEVVGTVNTIGAFLVKAGSALLDNAPLLFVIAIGFGMSENNHGVGALAALTSWLIINALLSPAFVRQIVPAWAEDPVRMMAYEKINNPFIGILSGVIGSKCFNRFKDTKLPTWLTFFSGKRSVAIISGSISVLVSAILFFLWPLLFTALVSLGKAISGMGIFGAGLYATLNRFLIPSGLHHALNNVFWFDMIGLGDMTNFWAGKTTADVGWSLGMYMSGFFPCMMFGIGGGALAIILCSPAKDRKRVFGILISAVICALVCGVTEPFEFAFMFACPLLYVVYSLLYGVVTVVALSTGFRAGFSFSAGIIDLVFSAGLPAAQKTWLILPLGIGAFILFFLVFMLILRVKKVQLFSFDADKPVEKHVASAEKYSEMAAKLLLALGGKENILDLDHCITRLRLEIADGSKIDRDRVRAAGAKEILHFGQRSYHVVIGTDVQYVADAMRSIMDEEAEQSTLFAPVSGYIIPMVAIPDDAFSAGILGPCCAIDSQSGEICAPADGEVIQIAETLHSVCLLCGKYEVLLHVGLDTVKLKGKGCVCHVNLGDKVKAGQLLLSVDIETVKSAGLCSMTVVAITNVDENAPIRFTSEKYVERGEMLLSIPDEVLET